MDTHTISKIVKILKRQMPKWKKTAISKISEYSRNPFIILISCILSLRTKDETTSEAAKRLFQYARTPEKMLYLGHRKIEKLIYPVGFYRNKAKTIIDICREIIKNYNSNVPDEVDELLKLKGVGRKTANLVVTAAYNKPGICVDTHVHRISNRLGFVKTETPEKTEFALKEKLPKRLWTIYNDLLVSFGQNICKPISPFCSICPVKSYCPKIGVTRYR